MKKLAATFLALLLLLSIPSSLAEIQPDMLIGENTRVVVVTAGLPDSFVNSIRQGALTQSGAVQKLGEIIKVQALTEGLLLLNSARADALCTLAPTARYVALANADLRNIDGVYSVELCMLVANDKPEIRDGVNAAIAAMRQDGTLDAIWSEHVEALEAGVAPQAVTMPAIDGGAVVRVDVSGDIPPMDYTTPDGQPAGYNTAIIAEIAKRANFNVEFVQMDSGARFMALQTGRIDMFFWQVQPDYDKYAEMGFNADIEVIKTDGAAAIPCLLSEPYAEVKAGWILRNSPEWSDAELLDKARRAAIWIGENQTAAPDEITKFCKELGVDDICAVDKNGVIALSNQTENVGFKFSDNEQSAEFLKILTDSTVEIVQQAMPRGADGKLYRYAGVAGGLDGGLTQVGVLAE